jgi:superfamily II DNA or RNA helicase
MFPTIEILKSQYITSPTVFQRAQEILQNDGVIMTLEKDHHYYFWVEDRFEDYEVTVIYNGKQLQHQCKCRSMHECCVHSAAALLYLAVKQQQFLPEGNEPGVRFTREEMILRVLREREERAASETYQLNVAENIYGVHQLTSASGKVYHITIRDYDRNIGYCSCPDFQTNKLGTCKHLIYAQRHIKKRYPVEKLTQTQPYPFVEIFCDPHNDYQITYFYKDQLPLEVATLLTKYFKGRKFLTRDDYLEFLPFLDAAAQHKKIVVRPEVIRKIDKFFEQVAMRQLSETVEIDFSRLRRKLYPFQEEGIRFALFKTGCIIADEMGLGKTAQAIGTAVLKKTLYGLKKVLVICPASLKTHWQNEIELTCNETNEVISGSKTERTARYQGSTAYFLITNYESVVRDLDAITANPPDMVILDEAQRIKNYETKTSHAVKAIPKKHALVITGTPIAERLGDLYSIMNFIDPEILAPLWEFSLRYCRFDAATRNKIVGYDNLETLHQHIAPYFLRRKKSDVAVQLPEKIERTLTVSLHPRQQALHSEMSRSIVEIIAKAHLTNYDLQRVYQLLTRMRMVCDATYLVDKETRISSKLAELREILLEKLDLPNSQHKVVVFSEFSEMLKLIEKMLSSFQVGSAMLIGEIPAKQRNAVVRKFQEDAGCAVLLTSDIGDTGLNLQCADTLINIELPWQPDKKHKRISRLMRMGQRNQQVTVINLVAANSIETHIARGAVLQDHLLQAIISKGKATSAVDLTAPAHQALLHQISELVTPFCRPAPSESPAVMADNIARSAFQLGETLDDPPEQVLTTKDTQIELPFTPPAEPEELETILKHGLNFLDSLYRYATGQSLQQQESSIEVNRNTGEVTLKFLLPIKKDVDLEE